MLSQPKAVKNVNNFYYALEKYLTSGARGYNISCLHCLHNLRFKYLLIKKKGLKLNVYKTLTVAKLFIHVFASFCGSYHIRSLNIPVQFTSVSLQPAPYPEKTEKKTFFKTIS